MSRLDYSIADAAEIMERIASSLLEKLDGPRQRTTAEQRHRAKARLSAIADSAELIAKVSTRLSERFEDL